MAALTPAEKPHQTIRREALDAISSDKVRVIVGSQFAAIPVFEREYYDSIASRPEYLELYKKWVLDLGPIPMLDDSDLYRLRDGILGTSSVDRPLLYLLLDVLNPFMEKFVAHALAYYRIEDTSDLNHRVHKAVIAASIHALRLVDQEHATKEGYDSFIVAFLDMFKVIFSAEIGSPPLTFATENDAFVAQFEHEWQRLYPHSDYLYGFEVLPGISIHEMTRYVQLAYSDKAYRHLKDGSVHREVVNYIAAIATFKPVPDSRIRAYYRQELCKLFAPFVRKLVKRSMKDGAFLLTEAELQKHLEDGLAEAARNFDFFFASTDKLKKKQIPRGSILSFPVGGRLAKLGHIYAVDEYPFTAYIVRTMEDKIRKEFPIDKTGEHLSLDKEIFDDEGMTYGDTMSDTGESFSDHLPPYDARVDVDSDAIGWTIRTFAGITGKSVDTLRRWDRNELLKPQRYDVYARRRRQTVSYRAYTRDDIEKASAVAEVTDKKMRHQK